MGNAKKVLSERDIMGMFYGYFGLVFPEGNLYDGNYDTVELTGKELKESNVFTKTQAEDSNRYLTHQYLYGENLYTIITNESNTKAYVAVELDISKGNRVVKKERIDQ